MTPQRAYTQLKSLLPQLIDSCMPTNHSLLPYLRLAFVLTQLVFFFFLSRTRSCGLLLVSGAQAQGRVFGGGWVLKKRDS